MGLTRREMLKVGVLAGGALLLPLERGVRAATANRMAESKLPSPSPCRSRSRRSPAVALGRDHATTTR